MIKTEVKTIPITSNTMFKELFGREENKNVLAFLLSNYFEVEYDYIYNNIKYMNTQLGIDNVKDYKYNVDIIISLDNNIVCNLEMNDSSWPGLFNRNTAYISNIFSSQFKVGDEKCDFVNAKKHIQINFNNYNFPKDMEFDVYKLKSVTTNEELTDILEIHHINLAMINGKCYNDVKELSSVEKVGKFLKSENINEMERIVGEDMKDILDKVMELSNDERLVGLYNEEELQKAKEVAIKTESFENGMKAGVEEGIKQGVQQGSKQEKLEIAKKMLEKNTNIDFISEVTGLTIDEISNIKF